MVIRALKSCCTIALILLIGQIELSGETIAERFHRKVKRALAWGGQELKETKLFTGAGSLPVDRWIHNFKPAPAHEETAKEKDTPSTPEEINASDRESLLRLLQQ